MIASRRAVARGMCNSDATTSAHSDLPHPGGPQNSSFERTGKPWRRMSSPRRTSSAMPNSVNMLSRPRMRSLAGRVGLVISTRSPNPSRDANAAFKRGFLITRSNGSRFWGSSGSMSSAPDSMELFVRRAAPCMRKYLGCAFFTNLPWGVSGAGAGVSTICGSAPSPPKKSNIQ